MKKIHLKSLKICAISLIVVGILAGVSFVNSNFSSSNKQILSEPQTSSSKEAQPPELENKTADKKTSAIRIGESLESNNGAEDQAVNIFGHLPEELLRRDPNIKLTPTPGYLITTSILSNSGDKIVYSEISDCIKTINTDPKDLPACDWQYYIFVKDLKTNEKTTLYSDPNNTSYLQKWIGAIVKRANAGRPGRLTYFPIAWSKNDQKIILKNGTPKTIGSCGAPFPSGYILDSVTAELEPFEPTHYYEERIFIDHYGKMIVSEHNPQALELCGMLPISNQEKILLKNIDTGENIILIEEAGIVHSRFKVDEEEKVLSYSVQKVKPYDEGCNLVDESIPIETREIQLP